MRCLAERSFGSVRVVSGGRTAPPRPRAVAHILGPLAGCVGKATTRVLLSRVRNELREFGLLPFTDREVPSVVSIVAGAPVSGSWWGHPAGQSIYEIGEAVGADLNILVVRLWRGKLTLVHRRLWPALVRIGKARAPWQVDGLGVVTSQLLSHIESEGTVRSDQLATDFSFGAQGLKPALRSLETRLLVLTRSVHTQSGAHALNAESWDAWAARTRTPWFSGSVESAQRAFEDSARRLTPRIDPGAWLPWGRPGRRASYHVRPSTSRPVGPWPSRRGLIS